MFLAREYAYSIHEILPPWVSRNSCTGWVPGCDVINEGLSLQTMVVLVSVGSGTTRTPVRNKQNPKLTCLLRPEHLREASDEAEPCPNPTTQVPPIAGTGRVPQY